MITAVGFTRDLTIWLSIEYFENKAITRSLLFENEIRPGDLKPASNKLARYKNGQGANLEAQATMSRFCSRRLELMLITCLLNAG